MNVIEEGYLIKKLNKDDPSFVGYMYPHNNNLYKTLKQAEKYCNLYNSIEFYTRAGFYFIVVEAKTVEC